MHARFLSLVACVALACQPETGPDILPQAPPAFRGTIAQITEDGGYLVDDGSATACGFTIMHITAATELWWRVGGRASRDDLGIGRRVSIWQSGDGGARCSTIDARAVVIEHIRL